MNTSLKKYHYPISSIDSSTLQDESAPFKDLKHMANDFINENLQRINGDLEELVKERFKNKYPCPIS